VSCSLFFWAFQPETKGLNLEDMDELFRDHPLFVPGSKWQPSSHIDQEASKIRRLEEEAELKQGGQTAHVEQLA
jgi:hypothetical protein